MLIFMNRDVYDFWTIIVDFKLRVKLPFILQLSKPWLSFVSIDVISDL